MDRYAIPRRVIGFMFGGLLLASGGWLLWSMFDMAFDRHREPLVAIDSSNVFVTVHDARDQLWLVHLDRLDAADGAQTIEAAHVATLTGRFVILDPPTHLLIRRHVHA